MSLDLVIVDFASSTSTEVLGCSMIGTNAYRPPEVTLGEHVRVFCSRVLRCEPGLSWDKQVDVFSCGCLLAELCTGEPLFGPSCSVAERMKALERVVEPFPPDMAENTRWRFPSLFQVNSASVRILAPRGDVATMQRLRRISCLPTLAVSVRFAREHYGHSRLMGNLAGAAWRE